MVEGVRHFRYDLDLSRVNRILLFKFYHVIIIQKKKSSSYLQLIFAWLETHSSIEAMSNYHNSSN